MSVKDLTREQQDELVRGLLLLTDDFCRTHGINTDGLNPDEWEVLREQLAACYRQAQYLIGAKKIM
jgi:hypothetical protein